MFVDRETSIVQEEAAKWTVIKTDFRPDTGALCDTVSYLVNDLAAVNKLQVHFDSTLGVSEREGERVRAYNPVFDRWKYEQLTSPSEKERFKTHTAHQMETNLRERYRTAESITRYSIDANGKLRNKLFPDEAFEEVLKRGVLYRAQNGSKEWEREQQEVVGFQKLQEWAANPIVQPHTKKILISPPGQAADTPYKDNFVDIFELKEDEKTHERYLEATRFSSAVSPEMYAEKALLFDPQYFDSYEGPFDVWYLSHLLSVDSADERSAKEIFEDCFTFSGEVVTEEEFQAIYKTCIPFILYYVDSLCREPFDVQNVAIAFNAILNFGDQVKRARWKEDYSAQTLTMQFGPELINFASLAAEVDRLGRQTVTIVAAGCGESAGFSLTGAFGTIAPSAYESLLNSVSLFSGIVEDEYGSLVVECPDCKFKNIRLLHKLINACGLCKGTKISCKAS